MNFILNIGLTGISRKKAFLFGERDYPITIFCCLFFSVVIFKTNALIQFMRVAKTHEDMDDYFIKNADQVRLYKKKILAKARAQAKADSKSRIEMLEEGRDKYLALSQKRFQHLLEAESTIKTLTRLLGEHDEKKK